MNTKRLFTALTISLALAFVFAISPISQIYAAFPGLNGKIIFRFDTSSIYSVNLDGSDLTNITGTSFNNNEPAVSPDGTKIAFRTNRDGNDEIYVANIDGSNPVNISNDPGSDAHPCWSPDGTKVCFKSTRDGDAIFYVDIYTNQLFTTAVPAGNAIQRPAWSPDGQQFAFYRVVPSFGGEIFTIDIDGNNYTRLTTQVGQDFTPDWSPNGSRITFYSNRDGNDEIFSMNSGDGSDQIQLTHTTSVNTVPKYSPDGTKIVFQSDRSGNNEVYTMNVDGSGQQLFVTGLVPSMIPVWQPLTILPTNLMVNPNLVSHNNAAVLFDVLTHTTDAYASIDPQSVTIITHPTQGVASVNLLTGVITYTPNPGVAGTDYYTYRVCSTANALLCTTNMVHITLVQEESLAPTGRNNHLITMVAYTISSVATLYIAWWLRKRAIGPR